MKPAPSSKEVFLDLATVFALVAGASILALGALGCLWFLHHAVAC